MTNPDPDDIPDPPISLVIAPPSKPVEGGVPVAAKVPAAGPAAVTLESKYITNPPAPEPEAKKPEVKWLDLEPEDRTDEVPHEAAECRDAGPGWQVAAGSVRGKLHAHNGGWREDSFAWATSAGWCVLAAADGAGSARLARVGSKLAADTAVATLADRLGNFHFTSTPPDATQPPTADLLALRDLLTVAGDAALDVIRREADTRAAAVRDFHTTLLVVLHTAWHDRHLVAVLQVGDGAVGLACPEWPGGFKRLGLPDHGDYSSETRFLTTPGIDLEFRNRVLFSLPVGLAAVAVMTDGVADDFFPEDTRLGELFHADAVPDLTAKGGGPLRGILPTLDGVADPAAALTDWLRYERRGSSDDRTLLLLRRTPGGAA